MKPRILITLDEGHRLRGDAAFPVVEQKSAYAERIAEAGGLPLWVSPTEDGEDPAALIELSHGLLITGGAFDLAPELYGETPKVARRDREQPRRTRFERALLEAALERDRPVLGICGGMQLLCVVTGGTLHQDIHEQIPGALEHEQPHSPAEPHHRVRIDARHRLAAVIGLELEVNSTHHQAVAAVRGGLEAVGAAPDGVIEAISDPEARRVGVQWHPELLSDPASRALYAHFVGVSAEEAKRSNRRPA